jgi:hypothetical protein
MQRQGPAGRCAQHIRHTLSRRHGTLTRSFPTFSATVSSILELIGKAESFVCETGQPDIAKQIS